MAPSTSPEQAPARWRRRWMMLSVKAALAVAGLSTLAHWASHGASSPDRVASGPSASPGLPDPVVTGSLRPKPVAAPAPAVALDQRGLMSLVAQTQTDSTRVPAPKKR